MAEKMAGLGMHSVDLFSEEERSARPQKYAQHMSKLKQLGLWYDEDTQTVHKF